MTQQRFEQESEARWRDLENLVQAAEQRRFMAELETLPSRFRQLCADLSLAQHRMYGARLCGRLNALVIRTRNVLVTPQGSSGAAGLVRLWGAFPRTLRREWRLFWLSMLLFWVPFLAMIAAAYYDQRWIFAVLGEEDMRSLDGMYGRDTPTEFLREEFGSDFAMFAFYIYNNVGIGLRTIAGGALATIGAVFTTAAQGVILGAMFGYVHYAGNLERFYTFVAGHSAPELLGLIICGAAGIRLGLAVIKPGMLSRADALRVAGREALPMIYGGPLMVLGAAFIEGFWSASAAPPPVKHMVGIVVWVLVAGYLLLAGRRETDAA